MKFKDIREEKRNKKREEGREKTKMLKGNKEHREKFRVFIGGKKNYCSNFKMGTMGKSIIFLFRVSIKIINLVSKMSLYKKAPKMSIGG